MFIEFCQRSPSQRSPPRFGITLKRAPPRQARPRKKKPALNWTYLRIGPRTSSASHGLATHARVTPACLPINAASSAHDVILQLPPYWIYSVHTQYDPSPRPISQHFASLRKGRWTVDCGLWTVDCGLWTVDWGLGTGDVCFSGIVRLRTTNTMLAEHYVPWCLTLAG